MGIDQPHKIVEELLFDSLLPAKVFPPKGILMDIGSGAGIPAIPLKIIRPEMDFYLLEPRGKRVSFLKDVIRSLDLRGVKVIRKRIEDLDKGFMAPGFDIISSRGVMDPLRLLELAGPYLSGRGLVVLFLGPSQISKGLLPKRDITPFEREAKRMDFEKKARIDYRLPLKGSKRSIMVMKRAKGR